MVAAALQSFGQASGLRINMQKSSVTCIRCDEELASSVAQHFGCRKQEFPIKYLGLPLSVFRLRRHDIMPLVERYSNKMKGWKPKLLPAAGRLTLVNSVLMALPIHLMAVLPLPVWAIKIINRKCRGFIWKGEEEVSGGHCLVPWR